MDKGTGTGRLHRRLTVPTLHANNDTLFQKQKRVANVTSDTPQQLSQRTIYTMTMTDMKSSAPREYKMLRENPTIGNNVVR